MSSLDQPPINGLHFQLSSVGKFPLGTSNQFQQNMGSTEQFYNQMISKPKYMSTGVI